MTEMSTAELLTLANRKAEALAGLTVALECGRVGALRIDGETHLFVRHEGRTWDLLIRNTDHAVFCRGYRVTSTHADLAREAHRDALTRGPHVRG